MKAANKVIEPDLIVFYPMGQMRGDCRLCVMKENNQLAFVICDLLELSSELPQQLIWLVLMRQVYRVMRLNRGETYHK
ncbi:hypothetical protein GC102_36545 [Paenibacillus sp. LMG 31460]|uniref:Uncharacterized protein n=2 Tax=Paenibacillus germinis TaxID=2654979 RepID=A0ABX1ZE96_9BACL|nr:hypothetical protein [Paenibacillus germinis]